MEPRGKKTKTQSTGLKLVPVEAKTPRQKDFFRCFRENQVISLSGYAGTGKTFIAMYQALKAVENKDFDKLLIIRSAVASRQIGFLPGNKKEKMEVYEGPYISNATKLYERSDAYQILKQRNVIQFEGSAFFRGETFDNTIVIIDEAQNMSEMELYTLLTRVGENCKIIICGDVKQDDLTNERYKEVSGYINILQILDRVPDYYEAINFEIDDIVRSGFVREFIIASTK